MHTCTHAGMHACIHTCTHAGMHAHMHTCTHACMHTCMHTCMHAHMHVCIHHTRRPEANTNETAPCLLSTLLRQRPPRRRPEVNGQPVLFDDVWMCFFSGDSSVSLCCCAPRAAGLPASQRGWSANPYLLHTHMKIWSADLPGVATPASEAI